MKSNVVQLTIKKNCNSCEFCMQHKTVCANEFYGSSIDDIKETHSEIFENGCPGWELSFSLYMSNPKKYMKYL